jgi:DNA repair and recombination protein RAD54B
MGLGKSLQAIALIWTLLKQTPFGGKRSVAKRVLLVCPASLLKNWGKEFKRWLGDERIKVFTTNPKTDNLKDYLGSFLYPVLLLNYEKLTKFKDELRTANFDLIVCDEGHRLKNSDVMASKVLVSLPTKRRIILTGTPLQNDLMEFYEMVEFVNPGVLGTRSVFKSKFENVILNGRNSDATAYQRRKGGELAKELFSLTDSFILRRSSDTNSEYLPPKTEFVIFSKLNDQQSTLYREKIEEISSGGSNVFSDLSELRKLSNSVLALDLELLYTLEDSSAKFEAIIKLLDAIKPTGEKVILVSHWTSVLDLFEKHLNSKQLSFSRLDGSTSISDRQTLVDNFNSSPATFCFILSSKAGGVGLNLVGASRLIMVDIDWNPAIDAQAMARIWRPGQTRPCFIYRFIAAGTIEEYIYQRQLEKEELSETVMSGKRGFSRGEVKKVFGFQESSTCRTHEMMGCGCLKGEGNVNR